jgi:hypothetical protein
VDEYIELAYTGTQRGMTAKQRVGVSEELVKRVRKLPALLTREEISQQKRLKLHLGDCIGGDNDCHLIAVNLGCWYLIGHPPINVSKRAFCHYDEEREARDYIPRNHDMVDESQELIATPFEFMEQKRWSGTWATVRYALYKVEKPVTIIWPDGRKLFIEDPMKAVGLGMINVNWKSEDFRL